MFQVCVIVLCNQAWTQYSVEPEQVDRWVENLRKVCFICIITIIIIIIIIIAVITDDAAAAADIIGNVFVVCFLINCFSRLQRCC